MDEMKTYDWEGMLLKSNYSTLKFIRELMYKGEYESAKQGIDALFDFETRTEKREMQKALVRLMQAIILWRESPKYRTSEQVHKIYEARDAVDFFIEEGTELNYDYLKEVWEKAYKRAKRNAEIELDEEVRSLPLTWEQVFKIDYSMFDVKKED